jgi:hypothetical protein
LGSRDAALELLSDGHTVAPLIRLGYLHSLRGGKSFFMHYKHRTGERDFPQVRNPQDYAHMCEISKGDVYINKQLKIKPKAKFQLKNHFQRKSNKVLNVMKDIKGISEENIFHS